MVPQSVAYRRHFAALLVALAIAVPASAKDAKSTSAAAASAAPAVQIENFGRINEHYYRGALPHETDYPALARLGVKAMID